MSQQLKIDNKGEIVKEGQGDWVTLLRTTNGVSTFITMTAGDGKKEVTIRLTQRDIVNIINFLQTQIKLS